MKKKFKRIASLILAAVMVFVMAMPAMADEKINGEGNLSLTITNVATNNHTFTAYQIFSGTLNVAEIDGVKPGDMLSTAAWGSGITEEGQKYMLDLAKEDNDKAATASDVAAWLADKGAETLKTICDKLVEEGWLTAGKAVNTSTGSDGNFTYVIDGLSTGYYMVTDSFTNAEGTSDALSAYIVQLIHDTSMQTKASVPSVEKFVKDANNSEGTTTDWVKSADHDLNDKIDFQLKATLGSDAANSFSEYESYYFAFHDKQSTGLTFDPGSVKVFIDEGTEPIDSSLYKVETTGLEDGCTFEIIFENLKAVSGVKEGTVIRVEYQSTLNANAVIGNSGNPNEVTLEYSNNPEGEGHGTTPEDKVTVFTFDITVNKTDGKDPLEGAEFKLEKLVKGAEGAESWTDVAVTTNSPATTFNFKFVDDGIYKLEETKVPDGHNEMTPNPIYIQVTATHDVNGVENLEAKAGTYEGGAFHAFEGDDITFTFSVNTEGAVEGTGTAGAPEFGIKGQAMTDVVNQKGATLPETGGIGTTIFYVVGSVLVLGAVILLVTKRRMSSK